MQLTDEQRAEIEAQLQQYEAARDNYLAQANQAQGVVQYLRNQLAPAQSEAARQAAKILKQTD